MGKSSQKRWWSLVVFAALTAIVFVLDLEIAFSTVGELLYLLVILSAIWLLQEHDIFIVAAMCSLMALLGGVLNSAGTDLMHLTLERGLVIVAIWLPAVLVVKQWRAEQSLKQKNAFLRLLQHVAVAANQASDVDEALHTVLDEVCRHTGWPVGHVYLPADDGSGELAPTTMWHLENSAQFEAFRRVTEATRFAPGIGLPGRVLVSGKPAWIIDVTKDSNFPRAKLADDIGVRAAFGFPVLVGDETVAVLEFFSIEAAQPDEPTLEIMAYVGTQLGRMFERQCAMAGVRRSEQRYRALYDDNPSMFFTVGGDGKVISVNRFGAEQLGYTPSELIGESVFGVVLEEDRPIIRHHLAKCIENPGQIDQWEFHKVRKDGGIIWVREVGRAIPADRGATVVLIVCEDITQDKHAEQEREQLLVRETAARVDAESAKKRVVHILERVGDAFVALDKNWCYTYVNEKAGRMFNRRPEDLIGKHIWTEFPEGVGQPFYYAYQSAMMRQKPVQIEEYYPPWDRWFENRVYPTDEGLSIFFQDITPRKKAEQNLRDSEQRFRSLFNHAAVGIAHVGMDGRLIRVNPEFCKILKYSKQEILKLTFFDVTHPDDLATSRVRMDDLMTGPPKTVEAEKRYVAKDGSIVWSHLTTTTVDPEGGEPRYLVSVVQDITQRKEAERALRVSEQRFRSLFNYAAVGIAHVSTDGRFIRVNPELCRILGYSDQEMLSLTFFDVTHPDDLIPSRILRDKMVGSQPRLEKLEKRYLTKRGATVWVYLTITIVEPEDGGAPYFVSVIQDVTERKRAQEQARQRQAELAHVTRLSTIGELASGLAHEINQPLAAISNYVQVCIEDICSGAENPSEIVESLSKATAQCHRASQIIARLRHFIAKRGPRRDKIDINKLVCEVVSLVEAELRSSKVQIDLDLNESLGPVQADGVQIEQVIMNLVKNGLEAMENGSADKRRLTIRTLPVDRDAVKVVVKDTGHGLCNGEAGRVFEPFFTTKSEGMGMGLSISRTIIEAHGGRVTGVTNPDQGATFEFVLPTKQEEPT